VEGAKPDSSMLGAGGGGFPGNRGGPPDWALRNGTGIISEGTLSEEEGARQPRSPFLDRGQRWAFLPFRPEMRLECGKQRVYCPGPGKTKL